MPRPILFAPGTLLSAIQARSRSALERGALQPVCTHRHSVSDHGVPFQVRVVSSLARYRDDNAARRREGNPFLPYEAELFVTEVTRTHVCLLNKYNVLAHHTLIVTRVFEPQESPLTLEDFQALWACLLHGRGIPRHYGPWTPAGAAGSGPPIQPPG